METGLRAALLAAGLARAVGGGAELAADAYALATLRFIGCAADSRALARVFGDEIAFSARSVPMFYDDPATVLRFMVRGALGGCRPSGRAAALTKLAAIGRSASLHGRTLPAQFGLALECEGPGGR